MKEKRDRVTNGFDSPRKLVWPEAVRIETAGAGGSRTFKVRTLARGLWDQTNMPDVSHKENWRTYDIGKNPFFKLLILISLN